MIGNRPNTRNQLKPVGYNRRFMGMAPLTSPRVLTISGRTLGDSLVVEPSTLTRAAKVRILVPQPL